MIEISFATSFTRVFKKKIKNRKEIENLFWECVDIFIENPFHNSLKTHKLSGKLKNLWGFSIEYNLRVIFYFENNKTQAIFVDIGSHNEVY